MKRNALFALRLRGLPYFGADMLKSDRRKCGPPAKRPRKEVNIPRIIGHCPFCKGFSYGDISAKSPGELSRMLCRKPLGLFVREPVQSISENLALCDRSQAKVEFHPPTIDNPEPRLSAERFSVHDF